VCVLACGERVAGDAREGADLVVGDDGPVVLLRCGGRLFMEVRKKPRDASSNVGEFATLATTSTPSSA
jgi:hypothetical protein